MTAAVVVLAVAGWLLVVHAVVNAVLLRRPPAPRRIDERVSILVPMRDEERRIGGCVSALLDQEWLADVDLLVLDDGSRDGSAAAARAAGAKVIEGQPPPDGWLGKSHACAQLAAASTGSVLVFVDADVVVAADGVARAVAQLRDADAGLVSPYPRQIAVSWLERLVQPLLQWSWLTFLPLRLAERPSRPSLTAANGQLLVVDAAAYQAAGGHTAIRGEVVEDIALARAVKRAGFRAGVTDGTAIATCRMYDDPRALRDGYAKWFWTAFGSPAGGMAVALVLVALYVTPWVLAAWTAWAWAAAAAGPAGRLVSAVRTGARPLIDAVAQPLSVLAFAALVVISVRRHRRDALSWKGRPV